MSAADFAFDASAELYICRSQRGGRKSMIYRRFETAAEAIRHSIEVLDAASFKGTVMEAGGNRFGHRQIQDLYNCGGYPLPRPARERKDATQT